MELFMYGDARLLAGASGINSVSRECYNLAPVMSDGNGHTTEMLEANYPCKITYVSHGLSAAQMMGEKIHHGKSGYHATPVYNKFMIDGQWPTAGIELETIAAHYNRDLVDKMCNDLKANWFHFERDGSLDDAHNGEFGYELITEPLPPRVYRNPNTWIALENLIAPWLESYDHPDTGLHVHVGLNQFQSFDNIPIRNPTSRMYIGKMMSAIVYFAVVDPSFIDRVVLRNNTRYCQTPDDRFVYEGTAKLASGGMTGWEFIDLAIGKLVKLDRSRFLNCAENLEHNFATYGTDGFCQVNMSSMTGHGTEVNTSHAYTIEFRRAKGTIHSLSIHRIVELMTMIVRYAGKVCRNPDDIVSAKSFYQFVHDNTTSEPLRKLIEKATSDK